MYFCAFKDHYNYCQDGFNNPEALFLHTQIYHINLTNYTCGQVGCERTFQRLDSFKRHIRNIHSHQPQNPLPNICAELLNVEQPLMDVDLVEDVDLLEEDPLPPQHEPINDLPHIGNQLKRITYKYLSKLHVDKSLSRTAIQRIIESTSELLSTVGTMLENDVTATVDTQDNLRDIVSFLKSPFSKNATEYKRIQLMEKTGFYVAPRKIFIRQRIDDIVVDGTIVRVPVEVTITFVPLRILFKTIFSSPRIFQIANTYMHQQNHPDIIDDTIHTSSWKTKQRQFFSDDKFVIPLYMYYDEFECNNPTGSHTGIHKISAVYVSLRCFPLEFQSQLNSIFVALLAHYQDVASEGNEIFRVIVQELIFLESEGISVDRGNGVSQKIYFSLAMILGDNAGLNSILGYSSCSSNFFCRICKGHKRDLLTCNEENEHLLRTLENYNDDLITDDYRLTGIKENSIFNEIPSFHVVNNNAVDIMHDLLEGVCKYDMILIINYYTTVRMISLHTINSCIQSFNYGYIESGNKPPVITQDALRKKNINIKAAEMMCLVRNFGLMIGHLIPEGDNVWSLYTTLCNIMDIVLAPSYQVGTHNLLKVLIKEHHELYVDICRLVPCYQAEYNLTPKFHFMVHYWRIIHNYGPLRNFWCMRFEGKHKTGLQVARNSA
ncbi:uncharacterized protein LOC112459573, partial [Temnothorax curvispinosus]|uniref:Uncharacterized protein LOC112459573 n=1 Tax=Temnothorax curvispinosus TaxID=300111 RepID=A0A6J1QDZ4_9HYME